jgi:superfamily II DNA or RNA helicase
VLSDQLPPEYVPEFILPDRPVLPKQPAPVPEDSDVPPAVPREPGVPQIPVGVTIRDYQEEAIESWFKNQGRGIFKMATGTGKTITALALVSRFFEKFKAKNQPLLLIVVCPYKHLVDQWSENLEAFGVTPLKCYVSYTKWFDQAKSLILQLNFGGPRFEAFVVTPDTFGGEHFQKVLEDYRKEAIIIGDEVHNFGSAQINRKLPEAIQFRLGLSATPERFREDETQAIYDYFGDPVFELDLKTAIEMGALSRYKYFPIPTFLDSEEMEKYVELAKQIGRIYAINGGGLDDVDEGRLGQLLGERAMVLGHCAGKIPAFKREMMLRSDSMYQLVYCAQGRPPLREDEDTQIGEVQRYLGIERNEKVRMYVHETPNVERADLLSRFSSGVDLKYLLSMRCLDEGVDIPDARVAYILASSRNPRQSVQRRGRILRKPPDGGSKIAEIVDFLALPMFDYLDPNDVDMEIEKRLILQELKRARDFAELAENRNVAIQVLDDLIAQYGIEEEMEI